MFHTEYCQLNRRNTVANRDAIRWGNVLLPHLQTLSQNATTFKGVAFHYPLTQKRRKGVTLTVTPSAPARSNQVLSGYVTAELAQKCAGSFLGCRKCRFLFRASEISVFCSGCGNYSCVLVCGWCTSFCRAGVPVTREAISAAMPQAALRYYRPVLQVVKFRSVYRNIAVIAPVHFLQGECER